MSIARTYIQVIADSFPDVNCHSIGDGTVYEDLVWDGGAALPSKSDLDTDAILAVKTKVWKLIQAERDRRMGSGVLYGGYWYHTDVNSRIQFLGLTMMGANMPAGIMWKTMTGAFLAMTPTIASGVFMQIASNDTQIFSVAEQHRAALDASSDPGNYDFFSTVTVPAWPQVFTDLFPNAP